MPGCPQDRRRSLPRAAAGSGGGKQPVTGEPVRAVALDYGGLGYSLNRSRIRAWISLALEFTTPGSTGEFQAWFRTDADCLDYLEWLRWPGGFICPACGHAGGWRLGDGRHECAACHGRTSVTAGTIFIPLDENGSG